MSHLTLEVTGFYTYLHKDILWIMSHQMPVNLLLIYMRVVCAEKLNWSVELQKGPVHEPLFSDP